MWGVVGHCGFMPIWCLFVNSLWCHGGFMGGFEIIM